MKKEYYKKIEYYLYNFNNIDNLIQEIESNIIDNVNVSGTTWIKGITNFNNTIENQAIRLSTNKKIYNLKKWKEFLIDTLSYFKNNYSLEYKFIKLKYFEQNTNIEIKKELKLEFKTQKKLNIKIISLIAQLADKADLICLEKVGVK